MAKGCSRAGRHLDDSSPRLTTPVSMVLTPSTGGGVQRLLEPQKKSPQGDGPLGEDDDQNRNHQRPRLGRQTRTQAEREALSRSAARRATPVGRLQQDAAELEATRRRPTRRSRY